MAQVFLSYASEDNNLAAKVRAWLRTDGHDVVFLDSDRHDGIPASSQWREEIYKQPRAASALVSLVTDDYIRSQWCFAEVAVAKVVGCPVFPLAAQPGVVHQGAMSEHGSVRLRLP